MVACYVKIRKQQDNPDTFNARPNFFHISVNIVSGFFLFWARGGSLNPVSSFVNVCVTKLSLLEHIYFSQAMVPHSAATGNVAKNGQAIDQPFRYHTVARITHNLYLLNTRVEQRTGIAHVRVPNTRVPAVKNTGYVFDSLLLVCLHEKHPTKMHACYAGTPFAACTGLCEHLTSYQITRKHVARDTNNETNAKQTSARQPPLKLLYRTTPCAKIST